MPERAADRQSKLTPAQFRAAGRGLALWLAANSLAGGVVGVAIAVFSGEPGTLARFVPMGILFANAIGFASGFAARFVLPRYTALPRRLRFPLAAITLLAGGAFGTVLVVLMNPLTVFYQGRLLLLLVIVDSVIAVVVGLIVYSYERLRDQIEAGYRAVAENRVREERLRELAARSELKALKAQINPHFLFNALNSISALVSIDPDAAQRTLERLAGIFRATLLASENETVPLTEGARARGRLSRCRARPVRAEALGSRGRSPRSARDVEVPPLILQPVVENAVRHGISPRVEGGTVRIEARRDADALVLAVEDDGPGVDAAHLEDALAGGYGLRNVRDRLRTKFGDGPWFRIEGGRGRGMRVELRIPVRGREEGGTG